ncbi:MAG TPA: Asp-tRNA(Asn)/Glu-tRNA(Gln) amidotransferase subunit GatB [Luteibaculaceae bacterium]|nr:Asp-tRNA(Asn)/Glu-tRNA(Gln) amidotransferase subunit GatB [Luteibaculaceae bacterium]
MSVYDKYETVIGLEVHIQLSTLSKAYCADHYEYGGLPNTQTSPISLGHPGTLPKPNKKQIDFAIKLGSAIGSSIHPQVYFARKNYFYADLPKGYQITQDKTPICTGGVIDIKLKDGSSKSVGITRIHMEEDAGKSIHDMDPFDTLIDLNRAGVPLLELVSEPEMRSGEEAYQYLTEVRKLVRYLEICDGNMEEGSMRCDANISVRLKGSTAFGQRCEVKNMNSIRNVQRAIEFEAKRQIDIIEAGGTIQMETRNFDAVNGTTSAMRSKELAHDYRYFPEPDIQPLSLSQEHISNIRQSLPPLPQALHRKYTTELELSDYDAGILTEDKGIALYFEELIKHTRNYKAAANWIMVEIKAVLNSEAIEIGQFPITPQRIAALINLIDQGKVSHTTATGRIFPEMLQNTDEPMQIAERLNLIQDSSEDEIKNIAQSVIDAYPDKAAAYRAGNKNLLGLFMGDFMKKAKGKANPKVASEILQQLLEN